MEPSNGSYGIGLLDDIHTHFPDILYNNHRFRTIGDVFDYVYEVAFNANGEHYQNSINAYHGVGADGAGVGAGAGAGGEPEGDDDEESKEESEDEETETDDGRIYIAVSRRRFRSTDEEQPDVITPTQRPRLSEELLQTADNIEPIARRNHHTGLLRNILRSRIVQRPTIHLDPFFGLGLTATQLNTFLEPVPIVPTMEQIRAASTTYNGDAADAEYTCTICQDSFQVGEHITRLNFCSHIFHTICINQWLGSSVRCPLCRHDIRELPAINPDSEPETDSIS